jgi:hypothetical protein
LSATLRPASPGSLSVGFAFGVSGVFGALGSGCGGLFFASQTG